jgi:hypothetical protein
MDLGTMKRKLKRGEYAEVGEVQGDFVLIFENCREYNEPGAEITKKAKQIQQHGLDLIKRVVANSSADRSSSERIDGAEDAQPAQTIRVGDSVIIQQNSITRSDERLMRYTGTAPSSRRLTVAEAEMAAPVGEIMQKGRRSGWHVRFDMGAASGSSGVVTDLREEWLKKVERPPWRQGRQVGI